ncbi:MAG: tRNA (adenosine(37)-N6)-threonylcarbamoyltransferase complex dimerization subunit type 1 TsaB [Verrucomicrobia bacterium]|nr:tRNA (adenosine(37)-N6)-threonylcarbamoyltransferase complex dimerization subunit type 1 TsaB [Verrucomicrobiota bacterium]
MLALGIETATTLGSLALARDGSVLGAETIIEDVACGSAAHSAELGPALDRLLARYGARLDEVRGIGVGLGPGSYTGLRVGVAFAKGLEFGLRMPLVGVPSFEAAAYACRGFEGTVCALVDARMGGIYAGLYRVKGDAVGVVRAPWVSKEGAFTLTVEGPLLFAGPDEGVMRKLGAGFAKAEFRQAHPDASYTALRAGQLIEDAAPGERFATIEPYYLRPSFAELSAQQEQKT